MDSGLFLLIKGIGVCFPNLRNLRLKFSQFKEVRDSNFHNLKKVCNSFFHNVDLWATQFWTVFDTCFQKSCTARNSFVHSFQQWIFLWTVRDSICSQFWTVCNSFFKIVNSARLIFPPCWINSARLLFFPNFEQCATHFYKFWTMRNSCVFTIWRVCDLFFCNFEWTVPHKIVPHFWTVRKWLFQILYSAWHDFFTILNSAQLIFPQFWMNSAWLIFLQKFEQWATHFTNFVQRVTHFFKI